MPSQAAIKKLAVKKIVASKMRTREWMRVPLAIRDRAFFSAGVEWTNGLSEMKDKLNLAISLRREEVERGSAYVTRSSFIGDVRKMVLASGKGTGTDPYDVKDLASAARLGLIYDVQTSLATGYARWLKDQDPDLLDMFPAQELLPSVAANPRPVEEWEKRWTKAGGTVIDGRIVGLKNDPAWSKLSVFGVPYPPFDFGSTRVLIDIERADAEDMGLLKPSDVVKPTTEDFNESLKASMTNVAPGVLSRLKKVMGDKIAVEGKEIRWLNE
jgi:hypothetical protein